MTPPKSKTMRVSPAIYDKLDEQRERLSQGQRKMTFSQYLEQCTVIGDLLINGEELYEADGQLFDSLEEARGHAIVVSVKLKRPARQPRVLLKLGKDHLNLLPSGSANET